MKKLNLLLVLALLATLVWGYPQNLLAQQSEQVKDLPKVCDCKGVLGVGQADYDSVLMWDCEFLGWQVSGLDQACDTWSTWSTSFNNGNEQSNVGTANAKAVYYCWWANCMKMCITAHTDCKTR